MKEDLLQFLWQHRAYDIEALHTTSGAPIAVLKQGQKNTDAGPDFSAAKIQIGDITWAGNVEIHLKSSDWHKHKHAESYDNTILHVVWQHDAEVYRKDGSMLPVMELKNHVSTEILSRYQLLMDLKQGLPCGFTLKNIEIGVINLWLERMAVERLQQRQIEIQAELKNNGNNWDDAFYVSLLRSFGFGVNAAAMELLAHALPQKILAKHKHDLPAIEALLFGMSGLLPSKSSDSYVQQLQKEFSFQRQKYDLQSVSPIAWKFARMRPVNFPTVRLAQFAQLVHQSQHLFSKVLEADTKTLLSFFDIAVSEYWQRHYTFEKESECTKKVLGKQAINGLIINTIVPFLFAYGLHTADEERQQKALDLLQNTLVEDNKITALFEVEGLLPKNGLQSQGMLHLHRRYCTPKNCLQCSIGVKAMNTTGSDE